jgi:LacI family transcriptional regulator
MLLSPFLTFKLMGVKKEVTIYDIANALKLSPSTISRALSGIRCVRPQTRKKIEKAASDLGYQRNFFASRLKTKKSQLIAAMVTHLNSSIASGVLTGAEIIASQLGYNLIVRQSMNKPELRTANIESLRNHSVDGLLVTSAYFQEYASVKEFARLRVPLVVIEVSSMLPGHPKKKAGDFENAYELTEHLIKKGCKRIAYLSVDSDSARHQQLVAGYRKALQDSNLPNAHVLMSNDFEDWIDMCRMLVSTKPRPDGIIISSQAITVLAFSGSDSSPGNSDEFWITCRKGVSTSQNQLLVELGKVAAGLVICLTESMQAAAANDITGMTKRKDIQPVYK